MARTYRVWDYESQCILECIHPDDYANAIRQRDAAIEIAWDMMIQFDRLAQELERTEKARGLLEINVETLYAELLRR